MVSNKEGGQSHNVQDGVKAEAVSTRQPGGAENLPHFSSLLFSHARTSGNSKQMFGNPTPPFTTAFLSQSPLTLCLLPNLAPGYTVTLVSVSTSPTYQCTQRTSTNTMIKKKKTLCTAQKQAGPRASAL